MIRKLSKGKIRTIRNLERDLESSGIPEQYNDAGHLAILRRDLQEQYREAQRTKSWKFFRIILAEFSNLFLRVSEDYARYDEHTQWLSLRARSAIIRLEKKALRKPVKGPNTTLA